MKSAAQLGAMMPATANLYLEGPVGTDAPAVAELRALADIDVAHLPEHLDLDAVDRAGRLLDARSHADDLRLPPPPRQTRIGGELSRNMADSIETYRQRRDVPVAADPAALEAEARLMAACEGICRFQDHIFGARQRANGPVELALTGRKA